MSKFLISRIMNFVNKEVYIFLKNYTFKIFSFLFIFLFTHVWKVFYLYMYMLNSTKYHSFFLNFDF